MAVSEGLSAFTTHRVSTFSKAQWYTPRTTSSLSWLHFLWKHTYGAGGCRSRPLTWWKCAYAQLDSPFKPSTHPTTHPPQKPPRSYLLHVSGAWIWIIQSCSPQGAFRFHVYMDLCVLQKRERGRERRSEKPIPLSASDFWSSLTVGRISSHHGALFHPTRVPVVGLSSWKFYEKLWELLQGQFHFLCEDNSPFFKKNFILLYLQLNIHSAHL